MNIAKVAIGVGGASVIGFVALRLYIREQVYQTLAAPESEGGMDFDNFIHKNTKLKPLAKMLNIPTSVELSESIVPIFGFTGPYTAIEDILDNGRKSIFWPETRKKSNVPAYLAPDFVDTLVFSALRGLYNASKKLEEIEAKEAKENPGLFLPSRNLQSVR